MTPTLEDARARDANDALTDVAAAFDLPEGIIYLDGNSLGPPPRRALARLREAANAEWAQGLIRSWNDAGWIDLPKSAGAKIAALIGAGAEDVLVCDSVSVNLFKIAAALLQANPGMSLAVDEDEFPTDQYVLEGLARMTGARLVRLRSGEIPERAVLTRSLVHYKTAEIRDMATAEKAAARNGTTIIWDLSHATGLAAVDVKAAGARHAVGCGYKYLNGGPGAPAFIYVSSDASGRLSQPLSGWMGAAAPFEFTSIYAPAPGVQRFAAGTPPILSLAALDGALEIFNGVDMNKVEEKARALGDFFLDCVRPLGFEPLCAPGRRGGHICLKSPDGYRVMQALIARGVIGDFRAPDLMRFGFSPLFLKFEDVRRAADIFRSILDTEEWRRPEFSARAKVT